MPHIEDEIQGPYEENIHGDGPAVGCALYLAKQVDGKKVFSETTNWVFCHIPEFVHLLKPVDILKLSEVLVKYCQVCDEDQISRVFSDDFQEMRCWFNVF